MRRARALLMFLALTASTLWAAPPATAGGPTSVLVSAPGEGRVAALYHTDTDYTALAELVGLTDGTERAAASESEQTHETGQVVTLTWLIHDVHVWRVDRVNLGAAGGPWVETRELVDERWVWDAPAVWHQADRRLPTLLDRVLPNRGATVADMSSLDVLAHPGSGGPSRESADHGTSGGTTSASRFSPVAWALTGLLGGAVLTAGATGVLRVRRRPRAVVVDEPATTADRLVWP